MKQILLLIGVLLLHTNAIVAQWDEVRSIRQEIVRIENDRNLNFIYDADLKIDKPYRGEAVDDLKLDDALRVLLRNTGITWERRGEDVLLLPPRPTGKRWTLSGYIYDKGGEPMINATVINLASRQGTVSNEYGFYSLTLPEGEYRLRFSYIGKQVQYHEISLYGDNQVLTLYLESASEELEEVVVTGNYSSPLETVQTGKTTLLPNQLNRGYALFSSPDLVKTLQNLPGVAAGTEMTSGLHVHGGENSGNLFLLDGTPLYQINHIGGLFSSFNTDVVRNVDFYKSGFPARYGGRLSSVVDVRTKEGDMREYHGSLTLGLIDGRFQLEGPLWKDRTSFNFGIRRTWLDVLTAPAFAIASNKYEDNNSDYLEYKYSSRYAMHDVNAKITHRFSDRSKINLNFYSGTDVLKMEDHTSMAMDNPGEIDLSRSEMGLRWGNTTASIDWNYQISPKLFANAAAVFTRYRSDLLADTERHKLIGGEEFYNAEERKFRSTVDDLGYRFHFDYRPSPRHSIRFGSDYLYHQFRPSSQSIKEERIADGVNTGYSQSFSPRYSGHELSLYAEDDMRITERLKANIGLHYRMFTVDGRANHSVEPRISARYQVAKAVALKASYTEMSQFMHQVSSTYLNLPSDYWMPSIGSIRPMRSRQIAAGVYSQLTSLVQLDVEGYYKTMRNMQLYVGDPTLSPSPTTWGDDMVEGEGRAYGLETAMRYVTQEMRAEVAYTLSKNERFFPEYYSEWFPDKYDNRHKLTMTMNRQINERIEVYAAWHWHSGNRMSVPTQAVPNPDIPAGVQPHLNSYIYNFYWQPYNYVYEQPNNLKLPAYHRLDVGINFRRKTKRGNEGIWNISIYNAYSRMNALYASPEMSSIQNGKAKGKAIGVFPIIPSFSYTLKF